MPPLPAIANVLQIEWEQTKGPYTAVNKFHFKFTGTSTVDALNALGAGLIANISTPLAVWYTTNWSSVNWRITDLTTDTSPQVDVADTVVGSATGNSIGANSALLGIWKIDTRYRGGHPRIYFAAGGTDTTSDSAHWEPDLVAGVELLWNGGVDSIIGEDYDGLTVTQLGTVSYYGGPGNPPIDGKSQRRVTPVWVPFNGPEVFCQVEMASQKRRIGRK
jgi:hypothetical protein